MGNAGSDYALFRRALLMRSMTQIDAAARALPRIGLEDALRILVVMAEKQDARYERAAVRWAARASAELGLGVDESRRVLALVEVLPEAPEAFAVRLRAVLSRGRAG
ncbi:hypothetical protein GKE82_25275 [Conexibacter sp. W3-3-2]|uniref:hypothetical protein n=1 Tax=Conexibacter sp. W3-3-2 TaxID=2675227 RepID=UPI0012B92151|nr:hypothetical protein [Conexibacter sp. W3-3-2]MTD47519.1 hypothetical protein [Conexibacter sp. W3-3-2]